MLQFDFEKMGINHDEIIQENNNQLLQIIDYLEHLASIHQRLGNPQKADRCLFLANQNKQMIRTIGA
jgi:hypothetical protein